MAEPGSTSSVGLMPHCRVWIALVVHHEAVFSMQMVPVNNVMFLRRPRVAGVGMQIMADGRCDETRAEER